MKQKGDADSRLKRGISSVVDSIKRIRIAAGGTPIRDFEDDDDYDRIDANGSKIYVTSEPEETYACNPKFEPFIPSTTKSEILFKMNGDKYEPSPVVGELYEPDVNTSIAEKDEVDDILEYGKDRSVEVNGFETGTATPYKAGTSVDEDVDISDVFNEPFGFGETQPVVESKKDKPVVVEPALPDKIEVPVEVEPVQPEIGKTECQSIKENLDEPVVQKKVEEVPVVVELPQKIEVVDDVPACGMQTEHVEPEAEVVEETPVIEDIGAVTCTVTEPEEVEAPVVEPVEEPVQTPVEVPVEAPVEVVMEMPAEIPVEEPVQETPVEVPVEEPVDVPVEEPVEVVMEMPAEIPVEEPVVVPVQEVPTVATVKAPMEESVSDDEYDDEVITFDDRKKPEEVVADDTVDDIDAKFGITKEAIESQNEVLSKVVEDIVADGEIVEDVDVVGMDGVTASLDDMVEHKIEDKVVIDSGKQEIKFEMSKPEVQVPVVEASVTEAEVKVEPEVVVPAIAGIGVVPDQLPSKTETESDVTTSMVKKTRLVKTIQVKKKPVFMDRYSTLSEPSVRRPMRYTGGNLVSTEVPTHVPKKKAARKKASSEYTLTNDSEEKKEERQSLNSIMAKSVESPTKIVVPKAHRLVLEPIKIENEVKDVMCLTVPGLSVEDFGEEDFSDYPEDGIEEILCESAAKNECPVVFSFGGDGYGDEGIFFTFGR